MSFKQVFWTGFGLYMYGMVICASIFWTVEYYKLGAKVFDTITSDMVLSSQSEQLLAVLFLGIISVLPIMILHLVFKKRY